MITLPIIAAIYTTGSTLYSILRNAINGQVWNGSAFEVYNSAHWALYAIPMTEQSSSGFYSAVRPAGVAGFITIETIYNQVGGGPVISDAPPVNLGQSAGVNIAAISGDALSAPTNLQSLLSSQTQGTVASGAISVAGFPTSLISAVAALYQGRILLMLSGAAAGSAALIANYTATAGVISLAGSLPIAPSAGDAFTIV